MNEPSNRTTMLVESIFPNVWSDNESQQRHRIAIHGVFANLLNLKYSVSWMRDASGANSLLFLRHNQKSKNPPNNTLVIVQNKVARFRGSRCRRSQKPTCHIVSILELQDLQIWNIVL